MTIHPDHPGLEVEVVVNDVPLKEYDDEEAPPHTVTKYVESTSGANFKVRYRFTKPFLTTHGVSLDLSLDGIYMAGSICCNLELLNDEWDFQEGAEFLVNGAWYMRKFFFSELTIGRKRSLHFVIRR